MRLDDDGLNISPEVAELLGYARPRPSRRRAPVEPPRRRPGPDEGDSVGWIVPGFFGLVVGVALLGVTGFAGSAARGPAPLSPTATSNNSQINEMASSSARVTERPTISQPAPEPPAVETPGETTPSVIQSQQLSIGGTTLASFVWLCQKMTCGLWNGREYVQSFTLYERGIVTTSILSQIHPRAWGCEISGVQLYCTIQDGKGQILQGCLYDGHSLNCRTPAHVQSGIQEEALLRETGDTRIQDSFPRGWYYVQFDHPIGLQGTGCPSTLPPQTPVFVSGHTINDFRLVLSEDGKLGCWSGGFEEEFEEATIPMHPDFAHASGVARAVNQNLFKVESQ